MDDEEEVAAIVVDNGSGVMKAGFAGNDAPQSVFTSLIGRPKVKNTVTSPDSKDVYIGAEAEVKRGILDLSHPIQKGNIVSWDDMERIWFHVYYDELRVATEEHSIMLTEPPLCPKSSREKMTEIHFELFATPNLYCQNQPTLSLYAAGRTNGCVCESGAGVTHTVPVHGGYALPMAIQRRELAGNDLTMWMVQLLAEKNFHFTTPAQHDLVRDVKEKLCFVALDYDEEIRDASQDGMLTKHYELPDGDVIKVGDQRFKCPELLFRPDLMGFEAVGCHEHIFSSIMKCDKAIRQDLYENIVCSGGSMMFKGIDKRIAKELTALAPPNMKINVIAPPNRSHGVWIGGSVLAALGTFQSMWITKAEYEDTGTAIVHKKCF